jgi:cytochrome c biogenesis protein CcmG, thiol:disulfide interchange protein DsbE
MKSVLQPISLPIHRLLLASLFLFFISWSTGYAQSDIPVVNLKALDGKTISSKTFQNDGKPIVISFWATWCKPCIQELMAINENYEEWQKETGLKLIAISIDDSRNSAKVPGFVNGKGWDYEVYLDENSDFKRAMNVVNVPHTFLVDGNGKFVWQHTSYMPGDEKKLYTKIKELTAK